MQACAGTVSTDADASAFWLNEAQAAVLANEDGPEASPLFMGGALRKHSWNIPPKKAFCCRGCLIKA